MIISGKELTLLLLLVTSTLLTLTLVFLDKISHGQVGG
jgi:hypothetical protein